MWNKRTCIICFFCNWGNNDVQMSSLNEGVSFWASAALPNQQKVQDVKTLIKMWGALERTKKDIWFHYISWQQQISTPDHVSWSPPMLSIGRAHTVHSFQAAWIFLPPLQSPFATPPPPPPPPHHLLFILTTDSTDRILTESMCSHWSAVFMWSTWNSFSCSSYCFPLFTINHIMPVMQTIKVIFYNYKTFYFYSCVFYVVLNCNSVWLLHWFLQHWWHFSLMHKIDCPDCVGAAGDLPNSETVWCTSSRSERVWENAVARKTTHHWMDW